MNFDGGYVPLESLKKLDGITTGEESDGKVMRVSVSTLVTSNAGAAGGLWRANLTWEEGDKET
jgi:hypothetical protein